MRTALVVLLLIMMTTPSPAFCDGKFYWYREEVPVGIPYQRAVIMFENDRELLLLQSKYELENPGKTDSIGWIVPLPAVPELASMDAYAASSYFMDLDRSSSPHITDISSRMSPWLGLILIIGGLGVLANRSQAAYRLLYFLAGLLMLVAGASFILPALLITGGRSRQSDRVDVLKAEQVGVYDVKVVRSDSSKGLIEWLDLNGFRFSDSDRAAFDDYIGRGWCFVAAKVNPSRAEYEEEIVSEGLVAPLIMRFPTKKAVYPLALTGTAGTRTEVLLYVLSKKKTKADERFELEYAGRAWATLDEWILKRVEPEGFFLNEELTLRYLCKYRAKLSAAEMKEDLEIGFARDNEPYRKRIVQW